MDYLVHRPGAPLDAFVDALWSLRDAPEHARERIFPSGTLELVVNLAANEIVIHPSTSADSVRLSGAIVSGCYGTPFDIETRAHASVIGVHFKPGGAARILGPPPGELADAHVDLADVWSGRALELREKLVATPDPAARFLLLERALTERLAKSRDPRRSVARAVARLDRPGATVGEVTRELGISRRRLIEIFSEDVGMTPKRFARVRRFQRALARATAGTSPRWADVALDSGYCDQAHLCREWAELTGLSPSQFVTLRRSPVKENHLALPRERVKSIQAGTAPEA